MPDPGSPEWLRDRMKGMFVMRGDCPLHGYGLRVKEEGDG